ncbi:MAG: ornithine--oxo-acid transaminase [Patescibacteria group bacterium]|nr:ornithine--oxo-acid transaminase [Patescibacteria group bacterium]
MQQSKIAISRTETYCAHNYHPLPVVVSKAEGVWVWNPEGHRYLDMLSSYSAVNQGHNHPRIRAAAIDQLGRVPLTSRAFYNDRLGEFAEKLCTITRKDKILPMNTGTEAVETSLKIARKWGHTVKGVLENTAEIITFENNFHGRTISVISFSTEVQYRRGFGPFTPGFVRVPFGNIDALEQAITSRTVAVLVEPVQGEGGVIIPPDGYLRQMRRLCTKKQILMIADEVQTGLARTGRMFACDYEDVEPDMYVLGKALSGGFYPISAVAADDDIMQVITPGDHGSTFGGNPLAAAIGSTALDVIIEEHLAENAERMGIYFINALRNLNSPHVAEVRGKGLLIGVDIKPESGVAMDFCKKLMKQGILCKDTRKSTMRFSPPLTITKDELDWALERIAKVLT